MGFKKGSIGAILMSDLYEIKRDRDALLEDLKTKVIIDKDLDFIIKTICTQNAIIMELEHIIEKAKKYKGSDK